MQKGDLVLYESRFGNLLRLILVADISENGNGDVLLCGPSATWDGTNGRWVCADHRSITSYQRRRISWTKVREDRVLSGYESLIKILVRGDVASALRSEVTAVNLLFHAYKVSVGNAPMEAVLWCVDTVKAIRGMEAAESELSNVNRIREHAGLPLIYANVRD